MILVRRLGARVVAAAIILLLLYVTWRGAIWRSIASATQRPYPSVAFVVECASSHVANDDPIKHPGQPGASHEHDFFGNRTTSASSTTAAMRVGPTSCNDGGDRTAYWLPTIRGAVWGNLRAYYSSGSLDPTTIETYPDGLQLIAGDALATRPTGVGVVAWSCGRGVDEQGWSTTPPVRCSDGRMLAVRISFPQCWDGRGLRPESVVAATARCPTSHPHPLPLLRLRVATVGAVDTVLLSSGGPSTMHADFWNAWDSARLGLLVRTCIRGERASNTELKRCRAPGAGPVRE